MIEKTVLQYLQPLLPCPVYAEVPAAPPEMFVLIEKTGSSRKGLYTEEAKAYYGGAVYVPEDMERIALSR